jgi:predicted RNA-binding protein with TRAM domain
LPRRSSSSFRDDREDRRKPRHFRSYSRPFEGPSEGPARPVPVEEGKEYDVVVESIGSKGDGIAKLHGFIIFVPNGKVGDRVKVRISAVRRNFAIGEIVKAEPAIASESPVTEETGGEEEETFTEEEGAP